ncbi:MULTISPECIES: glutaminase A [unclassified Microbacterium]|uniref:glutaminase A n=1 Tax=unclassified Microbacterium TaxID=2609290 RepID=UPI00365CD436
MFEADVSDIPQLSATGALPQAEQVDALVAEAHARYAGQDDGVVADYIPILAEADPAWFGLSVVDVSGGAHSAGDTDVAFSIQSISKAFVFALAAEEIGHETIRDVVGVDNTGLAFNSVVAVELNGGSPMNSMANAGAIATTALIPGAHADERWQRIRDGLSRFAGRPLALDGEVYRSESFTNHRNHALARLLQSYDRLAIAPDEAVDIYTRQCSLAVTAHDLAVMGATLADGGVNPVTGERVVSAATARDTLALLASCGMYERSGAWLFEIGLPAKSGVAGGIVAIAPGKGAVGAFSPRLDEAGNSVRGQRACAFLSRTLGLNLFASDPRPVRGSGS